MNTLLEADPPSQSSKSKSAKISEQLEVPVQWSENASHCSGDGHDNTT